MLRRDSDSQDNIPFIKRILGVDYSKPTQRLNIHITEMYSNIEEVDRVPGPKGDVFEYEPNNICEYFFQIFMIYDFKPWIILTIVGILTAITGSCINYCIHIIWEARWDFVTSQNNFWQFLVYWATSLILILLTACMGKYITPYAEDSGIPEIKTILCGLNVYKYLDFKVFFPKAIGLIAACAAGASIGKEGPFIHLALIIANAICKISFFDSVNTNNAQKKSMLSAAAACGAIACFGTPIGGILFSIEITTTYYHVSNMWRSFYAATWCIVTLKLMNKLFGIEHFEKQEFDVVSINKDLIGFALLGLLCAFVAVGFNKLAGRLEYYRRRYKHKVFSRFYYVAIMITITVCLTYPFIFSRQPDYRILNAAFSSNELLSHPLFGDYNPLLVMSYYLIAKIITSGLAISSPIPHGVAISGLVIGAMFGRIYGELMKPFFPMHNEGGFAIVGAAAVLAGITRSISVIMIVLELTLQMSYWLPVLIGVLISYFFANRMCSSIYDIDLNVRKIPYLPSLMLQDLYKKTAGDIMNTNFYLVLTVEMKNIEIYNMVIDMKAINKDISIPLFYKADQKILHGSVKMDDLLKYLTQNVDKMHDKSNLKTRQKILEIKKFFAGFDTLHETQTNEITEGRMIRQGTITSELLKQYDIANDLDEEEREFWFSKIDLSDPILRLDEAPLRVDPKFQLSKLHFLFANLGISNVFVEEKGLITGYITKSEFLALKK